ncbi:MAG: hypothetical protein FWC80_00880 [Firmicutes bacterium]|nr:hypothetical protein [Bacillota bacterium]
MDNTQVVQSIGQDLLLLDITAVDLFENNRRAKLQLERFLEIALDTIGYESELIEVGDYGIKLHYYNGRSCIFNLYHKGKYCGYGASYVSDLKDVYETMDKQLGFLISDNEELKQLHLDRFDQRINSLHHDIRTNYIQLGLIFKRMHRFGLYHGGSSHTTNTKAFYEYIESKYNYKKSSVCNMMAIVGNFCNSDGVLHERFENYSYTQLTELLSYKGDELPSPTATVSEIKDLKKSVQSIGQADDDDTSEQLQSTVKRCPHCDGVL